jgi:hypothetical protein
MLSDEERALVRECWASGPGPLLERGYGLEQIRELLNRPEARTDLNLLDAELHASRTLEARVKFVARRNLSRLVDVATATLLRAMAGHRYVRNDQTGHILTDAKGHPLIEAVGPNTSQIRAAEVVLDAAGVSNPKIVVDRATSDLQPITLLESAENVFEIELDPSHVDAEQQALSRERVRTTIDIFLKKLPTVQDRVRTGLGLPPHRVVKKKRVVPAKK